MSTTFWLAEAQSSQRDMLMSLQALKPDFDLHIIASHRHDRPEILNMADSYFYEPKNQSEFVIQNAIAQGVSVLLTGRNSIEYEPHRQALAQAGVRLLTGATDTATLAMIDDKFAFTTFCKQHRIPVADAHIFHNIDELETLIAQYPDTRLCIKPTSGIFAQGFWILDNHHGQTDAFYHLYYTEHKKIHTSEFLHSYRNSTFVQNTPMLLMPYLSGQEFSIDVVCEHGEILAAVTRHKVGSVQYIGYDESVMTVVTPLIQATACDGIVSVQTRADAHGNHHVLEINTRPSGGIGYTVHSGLDLTQVAFLYFSGLIDKPKLQDNIAKITPCKVRPLMDSIKI